MAYSCGCRNSPISQAAAGDPRTAGPKPGGSCRDLGADPAESNIIHYYRTFRGRGACPQRAAHIPMEHPSFFCTGKFFRPGSTYPNIFTTYSEHLNNAFLAQNTRSPADFIQLYPALSKFIQVYSKLLYKQNIGYINTLWSKKYHLFKLC